MGNTRHALAQHSSFIISTLHFSCEWWCCLYFHNFTLRSGRLPPAPHKDGWSLFEGRIFITLALPLHSVLVFSTQVLLVGQRRESYRYFPNVSYSSPQYYIQHFTNVRKHCATRWCLYPCRTVGEKRRRQGAAWSNLTLQTFGLGAVLCCIVLCDGQSLSLVFVAASFGYLCCQNSLLVACLGSTQQRGLCPSVLSI